MLRHIQPDGFRQHTSYDVITSYGSYSSMDSVSTRPTTQPNAQAHTTQWIPSVHVLRRYQMLRHIQPNGYHQHTFYDVIKCSGTYSPMDSVSTSSTTLSNAQAHTAQWIPSAHVLRRYQMLRHIQPNGFCQYKSYDVIKCSGKYNPMDTIGTRPTTSLNAKAHTA